MQAHVKPIKLTWPSTHERGGVVRIKLLGYKKLLSDVKYINTLISFSITKALYLTRIPNLSIWETLNCIMIWIILTLKS